MKFRFYSIIFMLISCCSLTSMEQANRSVRDWFTDNPALIKKIDNPAVKPSDLIKQRRTTSGYINLSGMGLTSLDGLHDLPNAASLDSVNLSNNKLTMFSPNMVSDLDNLKELNIDNNQIAAVNPGDFNLLRLETLNLFVNKLTQLKANAFQGATNLKRLGLSGNLIASIEPNAFDNLKNLEILQLDNNRLSSFDPQLVKGLPKLRILNLKSTKGFMRKDGIVEDTNPLSSENKNEIRRALPAHIEVIF